MTINYKDKYAKQLQSIKDNYKTFDLPYNGEDNDDYVNGQGFCCNDGTPKTAQAREMAHTRAANGNFKLNDKYEKMQFYYHPDHLGSSSYITNLDGKVSQHIEYVPFGEVFIEERNNTWNTPYLFNAKEFDEETGLYYYGARYYEPRLGLWMSVDPISNYDPRNDNNYLDGEHNGSVYNSFNIYPYEYCYQNSILLVDYTGKQANSSVLLARIPSGDYNFTPAASHLLHLVSKVNEYQIRVATVRFEETGILKGSVGTAESSLTAGKDPDHTVITHFYKNIKNNMTYKETNGKFFYEFFNRNTHEVGHIPQVMVLNIWQVLLVNI